MKKVSCIIIAVIVGILLYASTLGCQTAVPLPTEPHAPEPTRDDILWDAWLDYDANGGWGGVTEHFCGKGDPRESLYFPYTILGADDVSVKRDGYTFQYWNTEKDGSGTTYYPGNLILSLSKLNFTHLYAIWEKNADEAPAPSAS